MFMMMLVMMIMMMKYVMHPNGDNDDDDDDDGRSTMNCYHGDWNDYFFINRMMHGASLSNQTKIVVFQSLKEISLSSVL